MRNPATIETIESLRLRETIADFEFKMNSLGFQKPERKEFKETSASDIQKFLENKIKQQNQEYRQKAEHDRQKTGGYSPAFAKPSDLAGYISSDTRTQINNLLEQAIHNQGKGSFKSRNASAFEMAISKLGRSLSLTSMSSGGNLPQQKKSSLKNSQSLQAPKTNGAFQQEGLGMVKQSMSNRNNLKKPDPKNRPGNSAFRKKTTGKRISDAWSRLTPKNLIFKKTKQDVGTSRALAKPNKVGLGLNPNTSPPYRDSNFSSSRSGSISDSHQNSSLSNHSQSFSGRIPSQSIASRNRSISRSNSARTPPQDSFGSQNSLGSHASRISQSRSGGEIKNAPGR